MAADENNAAAADPDGERRSGRERRQRPPVTIDLAARPADKATDSTDASNPAMASDEQGTKAADEAPGTVSVPPPESTPAADTAPSSDKSGLAAQTIPPKPPAEPAPPAPSARPNPPEPSTPPKPPSPPSRATAAAAPLAMPDDWMRLGIAGVAGGVIALVLVIVLQAIGILPVPGKSIAERAIGQSQSTADAVSALDRRIAAVEAMTADLPAVRADVDGLKSTTAAIRTDAGGLAAKTDVDKVTNDVAALAARLDAAPKPATADDLAALGARVEKLESLPPVAVGSDVEPSAAAVLGNRLGGVEGDVRGLSARIGALEQKVATLAVGAPAGADARALAVLSLRGAADSGRPFANDLDMAQALGLPADQVSALKPFAGSGVATRESLAAEFPAVADAILDATAARDKQGGLFNKLVGGVEGLVSVRPAGPRQGNDPPAIVSRMRADVDSGDLAAALAEREGLPQAGKDASADWAKKASDRVNLDTLTAGLASAAQPANR
jgi:hypothetical protein